MQIWRAHGQYRRQRLWRGLCVLFFGLLVGYHLTAQHWGVAVQIALVWGLVYWGVPRLPRLIAVGIEDAVHWTGRKVWDLGRAGWQTVRGWDGRPL